MQQELFFNCEYYTLRIQTLPDRIGLMIETSHPQNRNIGEIPFLGHIWILRDMVFFCFFSPKESGALQFQQTLRGCVLLQGNQHEQTITFSSAQCGLLTNEWPQTHPVVHHYVIVTMSYMDVSENSGTPKSSIWIGFSIINPPIWGTPIFGNTYIPIGSTWLIFLAGAWKGGIWSDLAYLNSLQNGKRFGDTSRFLSVS